MNNETVRTAITNAAAGFIAGEDRAEQRAKLLAEIHYADEAGESGRPYRIDANGVPASMEAFLGRPVMRRADVALHDAASFIAYVNRFRDPATALVFANAPDNQFVGVLDYHQPGAEGLASWARHRATLTLKTTAPWDAWVEKSGTQMNQSEFGQFLEDQMSSIAEPAGATVVEMARNLEAKIEVQFESGIRAQNGAVRFQYIENVNGSAKGGTMQIPEAFTLTLCPYEGGDFHSVIARFRYRIGQGGRLALWYDLLQVDEILEAAFVQEKQRIAAGVTDTPVLSGVAPGKPVSE